MRAKGDGVRSMWDVVTASVRGYQHELKGKMREDSYKSSINRDLIVVAVSDGHGSVSRAREGADIAAEVFNELIKKGMSIPDTKHLEDFKESMLEIWRKKVLRAFIGERPSIPCREKDALKSMYQIDLVEMHQAFSALMIL